MLWTMVRGGQGCPQCSAPQRDGAAFCDACGRPLAAPGTVAGRTEGEAKQVTVMFVDIVGSMALSESLGADRWRTLLDRFFALCADAVHGVDGTVDKFTGDGIMAIFGAPVGYEDHAQRACLAALALHEGLAPLRSELAAGELELRTRVGLHSGEVVVGTLGHPERMAYTAIGHTVGVAARMERLAPPGSTAVSAATAALVRGEFELAVLDQSRTVKGVSGAQAVFELRGRGAARSRLDAHAGRGELSRYVGRHAERATLDEALERTLRGEGRIAVIVGDAGAGKSRLVLELARRCAAEGVSLVQARAASHGRQTPLAPVLDLLRATFAIRQEDAPIAARERIADALALLGPAFEADLPLMWDFLGVSDLERPAAAMDPEARQRRLLVLVADVVRARCRSEPLVLVLEDLHWLDDASRLFVAELVATTTESQLLLVLTHRPDEDVMLEGGTTCHRIVLAPLERGAVKELLGELLGDDPSVTALTRGIAARAGGNPFFCEELVQALLDAGRLKGPRGHRRLADAKAPISLPATVQATLAARIDALAAPDKEVLLVAAVVGGPTDWRLLDRVSGVQGPELLDALRRLVSANLLVEHVGDERLEYVFHHGLIQEVAYRTQLESRRTRTHSRVADELVALHLDHLDERAALIAHHAERAERPAGAAMWHARAATWAGMTTPREAMRHWQAAQQLADGLPDGPERTGLALGARLGILSQAWRLSISHDVAAGAHAEAVALLGLGQEEGPLRVLLDFALCANLGFGGRIGPGLEVARNNSRRAAAIDDPGLIVLTAGAHWYGALSAGAIREGFEVTSRAIDRAGGDENVGAEHSVAVDHPYGLVLTGRGYCAGFMGRTTEGMADIRRAVALAREHGGGEVEPCALSTLAFLQAMTDDGAGALASAEEAMRTAELRGSVMAINSSWLALVWAGLATGDHELAESSARQMLEIARTRGVGLELVTFAHGALSEVALARGLAAVAVKAAQRSVATAVQPSPMWGELLGRLRLAHALLALHGERAAPAAQAEIDRAWLLAARYEVAVCDPRLHSARAALARARSESALAEEHEQAAGASLVALTPKTSRGGRFARSPAQLDTAEQPSPTIS